MKNKLMTTLIGAMAVGFLNTGFAEEHAATTTGDATKGKEKSQICTACHSADGNSVNPIWPKLAGQGEAYIIKQLHNFKDDKRVNATMTPMAKPLSDQDILDLAAYFSSQKTSQGTANAEKVELGRAIYKGGNLKTNVTACAACHGPTGAGNPAAKYPKVSGQHAQYIVLQLKAFKSGERANDNSSIMRSIAGNMTEAEMEAVAEYMSGLH